MASLYTRKGSPFWWLKFRDITGNIKQASTGFRMDNAPDTRRAQRARAEKELEELDNAPATSSGAWAKWVRDFIQVRYETRARTCERYLNTWHTLDLFLTEYKIFTPAQLTRQHCFDYVAWRTKPNFKQGKYRAGRNTAIMDLKILRIIMHEAVERGYVIGNPCVRLKIERAEQKIKPELSDKQIEQIRAKIAKVPEPFREFFENTFEISRYQGCRLGETYLNPMTDVDLAKQTITFRTKGNRVHTTLLHPKLIPLFTKLQADKRTDTYHRPADKGWQWASTKWTQFFQRHKFHGICFHCLRVTAATALARNKVPENMAKEFIGHASTTVHRGYIRLKTTDLADCAKAIG